VAKKALMKKALFWHRQEEKRLPKKSPVSASRRAERLRILKEGEIGLKKFRKIVLKTALYRYIRGFYRICRFLFLLHVVICFWMGLPGFWFDGEYWDAVGVWWGRWFMHLPDPFTPKFY
jgi:hypothetical protein